MEELDRRIEVFHDAKAVALITETRSKRDRYYENEIKDVHVADDTVRIACWGRDNDQPQCRERLVEQNNIVPGILSTRRDILLGAGLIAYRKRYEDGKIIKEPVAIPDEAQAFFEENDIEEYLCMASRELLFHANVFTEMVKNKGKDRIASLKLQQCVHVRATEKRDGIIPAYYISDAWKAMRHMKKAKRKAAKVGSYEADKNDKKSKFIYHTGDNLLGDQYYYIPSWWGSKTWIELANKIPLFHKYNLEHGYNIRYHIEIPKGYFRGKTTGDLSGKALKDAKAAEADAKRKFIDQMNRFLAGVQNAGRAVYTDYELNVQLGKDFPGIKITTISADLKDEALLKLFEKSNQANISAQAIHPTLAAIENQGKLSSGSDIRNAYLLYLAVKTPTPERILMKPIELVKKINGWPRDIYYGFQHIELTRLDENPTGNREFNPATS